MLRVVLTIVFIIKRKREELQKKNGRTICLKCSDVKRVEHLSGDAQR